MCLYIYGNYVSVGDLYCLDGLKSLVVNKLSDALKIDNVVDVYMETRRLPSQETTGMINQYYYKEISEFVYICAITLTMSY